jgi:formiminotetrahydrofolate cyclodeaminase
MPKFADLQLASFLDALASPDPTPGGGTAAAIAGAMGASLLIMVSGLSRSRTGAAEETVALSEAAAKLKSVRERFAALADADSEAYSQVLAAYKRPKNTEVEKGARKAAIEQALTGATSVPLDTLRLAGEALQVAVTVAQHGNRNAASDVGVGIGLLQAAADGALANVRINLEGLHDAAFKSRAADDAAGLSAQIGADAAAAKRALAS